MIKKITIALMICLMAFAGVEQPFVQFAQSDYCGPATEAHHMRDDQKWFGAQLITLKVGEGTGVWLSNYMSNWYGTEFANDGGNVDLHMNRFDMSAGSYGYIFADALQSLDIKNPNYDSLIHWSNGATTSITYYSESNENIRATTTGYFLDYFKEDAEIYLVMTTIPADGSDVVDSYEYVQQDGVSDTSLVSRQHNTVDIAGNVRVNYGIDSNTSGWIGREFVAVYTSDPAFRDVTPSTGGPLPGGVLAWAISAVTVLIAKKRRMA